MLRCRIQSAFNKGLKISKGPNDLMDSIIAIKLESPKIKEEVYVAHRLWVWLAGLVLPFSVLKHENLQRLISAACGEWGMLVWERGSQRRPDLHKAQRLHKGLSQRLHKGLSQRLHKGICRSLHQGHHQRPTWGPSTPGKWTLPSPLWYLPVNRSANSFIYN